MRDLVERQAVQDAYCEHECGKSLNWRNCGAVDCGHIFDNVPSAQFEIIRCKDCKKAPKCYGDVLMKSKGGGYIYCPVEYCSKAERRTDG